MEGKMAESRRESLDRQIQARALALQYQDIETAVDYKSTLEDLYYCKTAEVINPATKEFVQEAMDDVTQRNPELHQTVSASARSNLLTALRTIQEMDKIRAANDRFDNSNQVRRLLAEAEIRRLSSMFPELLDTIQDSDIED